METHDMTPTLMITSVCVSFMYVFIKGFQHQNVNGKHYKLTFFTAYVMAVVDVLTIGFIVNYGWAIAFTAGTGSALGMLSSMYVHSKFVKEKG